jgi:hypothetical protein
VLFVLGDISNHTLTVCIVACILAFAIGAYGHAAHSRPLILAAIFAIAAITLWFVIAGELQTGTPIPGGS